MAERKIVVPEGMLKAVHSRVAQGMCGVDEVLEAALRWLSENPIVPTEKQERSLDDAWTESKRSLSSPYEKFAHATAFGAVEWQRHMFLAPEPEIPEEIKDLLDPLDRLNQWGLNRAVLEAYNRGQKAGKP